MIKTNIAISDNGFLFDTSSGQSYSVNSIGVEIIKHLKEHKNLNEVKALLLSEYEVEEHVLDRDLSDFEGMLKHFKLSDDE